MPKCKECKIDFNYSQRDLNFYKQIDVPAPLICPQCRFVRRLVERNTKSLYKRKCDLTGKDIISQFHTDVEFPVYAADVWWSDKWEALDYGIEYNPDINFFDHIKKLYSTVPRMAVYVIGGTMENSEFTNCAGYLKNCYLVAEADYNEECYYSSRVFHNKNLIDCTDCFQCEIGYENTDCRDCYNLQHCQECRACSDSYFLYDCRSCKDCIGCINQRYKQYMILNKQYDKEEYLKIKKDLKLDTAKGLKEFKTQCQKLFVKQPHKCLQVEKNENSFGNHLYNSKDANYCFDSRELEHVQYGFKILRVKNSMDYTAWGMEAELVYDCSCTGDNVHNMKFCSTCTTKLNNCEYCYMCTASSDLFGCVGLKNKKFCIFNKQYSETEYKKLKKQIIQNMKKNSEYGHFFPKDLALFAYNETLAMETFPITKEEALAMGYRWRDKEEKKVNPNLPICSKCKHNFLIIPQEKTFYKKYNIPEPVNCPECRHFDRLKRREPIMLIDRKCAKCNKDIKTTFSPDRPEIIYCEECFQNEMY